jgi:hypothetical protein
MQEEYGFGFGIDGLGQIIDV